MQLLFARGTVGDPLHAEYNGERLVGMYVQGQTDGGVSPAIIAPSPGLTTWAALSGEPVLAVMKHGAHVYAVSDGVLWRVNAAGVATALGALAAGTRATLAGYGALVACAIGGRLYLWNGTTLAAVDVPAFTQGVGTVTTFGTRFVVSEEGDTGRWSYSGVLTGTFDGLDFATAEAQSDGLVRVFSDHSELWLFGTRTTEVWVETGGADLPYSRMSGGVIERGCAFGESVVKDDNTVYWVGDDRLVYRAQGFRPQVISEPWVSAALRDVASCQGVAYTWRGAKHYALRIPGKPAMVYDAVTQRWHERATEAGAWRGLCADRDGAETVVGGADGVLYRLGGVTDGGAYILREGVSMPVQQGRQRMSLNAVQLHFRTGATDIGRAAAVELAISRDGREWTPGKRKSLGLVGQYDRITEWHGLGMARTHQVRWRITDPIEAALYGATVEVG